MLTHLLQVSESASLTLHDSAHATESSALELLAAVKGVAEFDQAYIFLGNTTISRHVDTDKLDQSFNQSSKKSCPQSKDGILLSWFVKQKPNGQITSLDTEQGLRSAITSRRKLLPSMQNTYLSMRLRTVLTCPNASL